MTDIYHDRQRNVLVYNCPDPTAITRYVEQARVIGNGYVAVPISLYNLQLLRWLGKPVVPLLNYDYDWPHGPQIKTPFRAQIITANFLALHPRAFCLSEPRTGKTLSLLWAADRVMRDHPPGTCRALVVCPLSILWDVWANMIFHHFLGRRTYSVLYGSKEQRVKALEKPADFYLINYDGVNVGARTEGAANRPRVVLDGFSKQLAERTDILIGIADEASAYKAGNTLRHRVARQILMPKPYLWLATGTPVPNGPQDAHGQARLINNAFGESFTAYRKRVMYSLGTFRWVPKAGAKVEAYKLLSPAVRFLMTDCVDVPPKLPPQVFNVLLSAAQKTDYASLRKSALLMVEQGTITAPNEAVLRSKLIQIACGAVYVGVGKDRATHELDCGPRIAAMYEVIQQATGKIIILAPLTSVLTLLCKELGKIVTVEGDKRPQYKVGMMNGSVQPKDRAGILNAFRDPEGLDILVADPGTLQHGIDLSVAKVILWFALPEKPEQYMQANERIRGANQKYPTLIAHLAATKEEREIYKRLESNQSLQGAMLSLVKGEHDVIYGRGFSHAPPGPAGLYQAGN